MAENRNTYKTSKVKSFLFFLLLAMIFWILAKFSTETTALVYANILYDNVPEHISVTKEGSDKLSFEVETNGFQALSYGFKQPSISIDISRYYKEGDTVVVLENADLVQLIATQLDNSSGINNLSSNSLRVSLDRLEMRKVAVKSMVEIQYKEGYRNLGALQIQPDSVLLVGPLQKLEKIDFIETENEVVKNASDRIEKKIKLKVPEDPELSIKTDEVSISAAVEEFTQKQFPISVQLINAPRDVEVKLLPSEINVSFNVAMSRFNSVSPNDFRLVCDYRNRNEAESFLIPSLETYPNDLYDVEVATKRVEYLIFK
ncbi:hypothetical protein POV27_12955 [Aureisphaera galaxeae]|uniref:hypothetical protein n=1 Tax=Aureisphaera galaxeae TaxID=1538023 RepID=UPI002350B941|nr:hypothetical protein [Aureisphaera galaxeae]MDC8004964.1 hypothetical protein [Aureisphaera galaxeae]